MSKQFYFKQFSLIYVRSLNIKTVILQAIQFSKIHCLVLFDQWIGPYQVLLLWPSRPGRDNNKELFYIPQAPPLLEPHHEMV